MDTSINIEAVQQLIDEKFRGNVSWFAEEIGVDRSYVLALLKHEGNVNKSKKIIVNLMAYCKKNNLDFEKYIIFLN